MSASCDIWPTPNSGDGIRGSNGTPDGKRGRLLPYVAGSEGQWATPTAANAGGGQIAKGISPTGKRPNGTKATVSLNQQVKDPSMWPTPKATDGAQHEKGRLNPDWVTQLMGFPEGWLDVSLPAPAKHNTTGKLRVSSRKQSQTDPPN